MKTIIITAKMAPNKNLVSKTTIINEKQLKVITPVIKSITAFVPYKEKGNITFDKKFLSWNHEDNFPSKGWNRSDLGEKSANDLYGHLKGFKIFQTLCPKNEKFSGPISIESIMIFKEEACFKFNNS